MIAPNTDPVRLCSGRAAFHSTGGALRLPVVLYYLDGLTVAETAQALGVPVGTVKFRLHQARKKLRVELDAPEGEGANVQ